MKQYTTPEQTTKLIEQGFAEPKSEVKAEQAGDYAWYNPAYSIGELIEILPEIIRTCLGIGRLEIRNVASAGLWQVVYIGGYRCQRRELIDALYEMLVTLKGEGVI